MEKKEPRKITTAEDVLAMSADELHEWPQRKLAERIAYHERTIEEERAARERGHPAGDA